MSVVLEVSGVLEVSKVSDLMVSSLPSPTVSIPTPPTFQEFHILKRHFSNSPVLRFKTFTNPLP